MLIADDNRDTREMYTHYLGMIGYVDAKTATTPIIVLTGHDLKDYLKHAAIAEGALSYLMKPCLPEQLAREIGAYINARSAAVGRSRVASAE